LQKFKGITSLHVQIKLGIICFTDNHAVLYKNCEINLIQFVIFTAVSATRVHVGVTFMLQISSSLKDWPAGHTFLLRKHIGVDTYVSGHYIYSVHIYTFLLMPDTECFKLQWLHTLHQFHNLGDVVGRKW